jgi:hypothetical protein
MDDWKWLVIIGIIYLLWRSQAQAQAQSQGFHNEQTLEWTDWRGRQRQMRVVRNVSPN